MRNKIVIGVMGVLLSCGGLTQAELITIAISGQVTDVTDQYGHLENKIYVGNTITGTYTYDSSIPDSEPSPESGLYYNTSNLCGISLYIDGFNFKTDPTNVDFLVSVGNWATGDKNYGLLSYHNSPLSNGALVDQISWQLDDPTGTALSSDALPLTPPDLSKWQSWFGLQIDSQRGGGFYIQGTITSAVLVPEPATLLMLLVGSLLLRKSAS